MLERYPPTFTMIHKTTRRWCGGAQLSGGPFEIRNTWCMFKSSNGMRLADWHLRDEILWLEMDYILICGSSDEEAFDRRLN